MKKNQNKQKQGDALHSAMTAAPPPSLVSLSQSGEKRDGTGKIKKRLSAQRLCEQMQKKKKKREKSARQVLRSDLLEELIGCVADPDLDPDVSINHPVWPTRA